MKFLGYIVSKFYCLVVSIWRKCYQWHIFSQYKYDTPIISIGNITAGGAGKTPMVIFLSKLLSQHNISHTIISRGYKKQRSGTIVITKNNLKNILPHQCGDEPYMIAKKLIAVPVIVDTNKRRAIQYAINKFLPQIILLDDGFQSLNIRRNLDIVLINSICKKQDLHLLPLGKLREPLVNIERANIIIYSKQNLAQSITKQFPIKNHVLSNLCSQVPFMESNIVAKVLLYDSSSKELRPLAIDNKKISSVLCVCGIGDPLSFIHTSKKFFDIGDEVVFPDHYQYSKNDILPLFKRCIQYQMGGIVTTYKDFVKISPLHKDIKQFNIKLFIIDIDIQVTKQDFLLQKIQKLLLV